MPRPTSREWNAAEYHRLSAPQFKWGSLVLADLKLRGDECVLDAGCGTGKLTRLLLENLPRGRVIGLDLSRNMVLHAGQNLVPDFGLRVGFVAADLLALPFQNSFDGIFSTASFHWVLDHDILFCGLYKALKPGGWLHAQCGGKSNLRDLRQRVRSLSQEKEFSEWLGEFREPWFFSDAEGAAVRMQAAGFENIESGLEQADYAAESASEFEEYLRTFILHRHLDMLPSEELRDRFVRRLSQAAQQDSKPFVLDYCRLNLRARKPAAGG
jgi:trans-aconitate 2-methyltransferase